MWKRNGGHRYVILMELSFLRSPTIDGEYLKQHYILSFQTFVRILFRVDDGIFWNKFQQNSELGRRKISR